MTDANLFGGLTLLASEWKEYASCKGRGWDIFDFSKEEEYLKVCENCPTRLECLDETFLYSCSVEDMGIAAWSIEKRKTINRHRNRYLKAFLYDMRMAGLESSM